jgi:hypothetical protein
MTFAKGQSGNPQGAPKRKYKRVDDELKRLGKDPLDELMKLMPDLSDTMKAKVWLEILSYCHAKPKYIELTEDDLEREKLKAMSTPELIELARKKIPELDKAS